MLRNIPKWIEIPPLKILQSYSFGTFEKLKQYVLSKWNKQTHDSSKKGKESASDATRAVNWAYVKDRERRRTEQCRQQERKLIGMASTKLDSEGADIVDKC